MAHNPGNADHTGKGLRLIREYIGNENWDIIQFNWGLHDLCYRHPDSKPFGHQGRKSGRLSTHSRRSEKNLADYYAMISRDDHQIGRILDALQKSGKSKNTVIVFASGAGAWLCSHIWEHYSFTGDKDFLKRMYPVMKGSVEFYLGWLVENPKTGKLVSDRQCLPKTLLLHPTEVKARYVWDRHTTSR